MHFLFLFALLFDSFFYFSNMITLSEPLPGVATEEFTLALEISDFHGENTSFVSCKGKSFTQFCLQRVQIIKEISWIM